MKREKKIGSAVLVAIFSLSCTTTVKSDYYLFAGSRNAIYRWHIDDDGRVAQPLITPTNYPINRLALSPDGRILVSGDWYRNVIHLWNVSDPRDIQALGPLPRRGHRKGGVVSLAFSPDGKYFASVHSFSKFSVGTINVWNIREDGEFRFVKTLKVGNENLKLNQASLKFSPDSRYLLSAVAGRYTFDIKIDRWNVIDPENVEVQESYTLKGPSYISSMALSPGLDDTYLALGFDNGSVSILDALTLKEVEDFQIYEPWGVPQVLSTLKSWLLRTTKKVAQLQTSYKHPPKQSIRPQQPPIVLPSRVRSLAFSSDGKYLVSAGSTGSIRISRLSENRKFEVVNDALDTHYERQRFAPYWLPAFSPDNKYLIGGANKRVSMWHILDDGKSVNPVQNPFPEAPGPILSLSFWSGLEAEPEPRKLHLKDPELQEEKIEQMKKRLKGLDL